MLDEEKRQLMILKERFFEDGDLHDGKQRSKKFEWDLNNRELEEFTNVLSDSEEESGGEDQEDTFDSSTVIRLKRKVEDQREEEHQLTTTIEESNEPTTSSNATHKITFTNLEQKLFQSKAVRKTSKISAFLMRDRRLTAVLSKKTETIIANPNKRLKSNDNKSIFDLF